MKLFVSFLLIGLILTTNFGQPQHSCMPVKVNCTQSCMQKCKMAKPMPCGKSKPVKPAYLYYFSVLSMATVGPR